MLAQGRKERKGFTMNYIGSKHSLLSFLEEHMMDFIGTAHVTDVLDIFAGTGAVGRFFKKRGFRVIANDAQYYSYCLNRAYVGMNQQPDFAKIVHTLPHSTNRLFADHVDIVLHYLNHLEGKEGFVYQHYCPSGTRGTAYPRQYFTDENGKKCDAMIHQMHAWHRTQAISDDEYFYLLASLIEAIDKVANTASVYGAFLKRIKPSARKPLTLERLDIVADDKPHQVHNLDAATLVDQIAYDILYMDPPYNQRQYCTNYHVLETIARYDQPKLHGVTGLRDYQAQKSPFCSRNKVLDALKEIIQRTPAQFVFLSYNSEGLMKASDVLALMGQFGFVELRQQPYRRFRADRDGEQRKYASDEVVEYLFCLHKTSL